MTVTITQLSDVGPLIDAANASIATVQGRIAALETRFRPAGPGGSVGNPTSGLQYLTAAAGLAYNDVLDRICKGQGPPIETVAAVLVLNGKTIHNLEADCRAHVLAAGGTL